MPLSQLVADLIRATVIDKYHVINQRTLPLAFSFTMRQITRHYIAHPYIASHGTEILNDYVKVLGPEHRDALKLILSFTTKELGEIPYTDPLWPFHIALGIITNDHVPP